MWACITWLRCHDQSASSTQSWWDEHKAAKSSFTLTPRWRRLNLRQTPSLLSSLSFMWFLCSHYDISHQPTRPERSRPPPPPPGTSSLSSFILTGSPESRPGDSDRSMGDAVFRLLRINSLRSFLGTYEKYICIAVCVQFTEQIIFIGWRF